MTTEQDLDYALNTFPNEEAYKVMLEGNLTLPEFVSAKIFTFVTSVASLVLLILRLKPEYSVLKGRKYQCF